MILAFRHAESESDRKFVISSWLDASCESYSSGPIPMDLWYPVMWPIYERLMARDGMQTTIAYERSDPDFMYGYIVADHGEQRVPNGDGSFRWWPALVLFVYVKQNFRREGIARHLFAAADIDPSKPFLYGINTPTASRLSAKVPRSKFNPLVARFPKENRT